MATESCAASQNTMRPRSSGSVTPVGQGADPVETVGADVIAATVAAAVATAPMTTALQRWYHDWHPAAGRHEILVPSYRVSHAEITDRGRDRTARHEDAA